MAATSGEYQPDVQVLKLRDLQEALVNKMIPGEPGGVSPGILRESWRSPRDEESGGLRRPAHLVSV